MRLAKLFPLLLCAACSPREVKLQAYDTLAKPGHEVRLQAKLERRGVLGVNPDLHGFELSFFVGDKEVGRARTGKEGVAEIAWKPPEGPGQHEFRVKLAASEDYAGAEAKGRVFLREASRPTLVVDLDGTICASPQSDVAMLPPERIAVVEGSPAVLTRLAKRYDLIYLTARDDALLGASRDWLDRNAFPPGPLLVRDLTLFTLSAEQYKEDRLKALAKEFRLTAGVGDRAEDAEAYMAAGLLAILVGDETDVPRGARKLVTWDEVARLID